MGQHAVRVIPRPDRAAARALSAVTSAAGTAAGEAADYAARVVGLLDGAERLLARAEALLDRTEAVTGRAEAAVAHVERTTDAAAAQVGRVTVLLEQGEPVAADALPKLRQLLEQLTDRELAAMIQLIDRTPEILEHVDETVVPTMEQMREVGPDIKELLAIVTSLRDLLVSVPGMGRVRKRIEADGG